MLGLGLCRFQPGAGARGVRMGSPEAPRTTWLPTCWSSFPAQACMWGVEGGSRHQGVPEMGAALGDRPTEIMG